MVVGTGAGPGEDEEDEDSDQFYERMDSPSPPLVTAQVNTALSSYKEKMMREDEHPTVGGHTLNLVVVGLPIFRCMKCFTNVYNSDYNL